MNHLLIMREQRTYKLLDVCCVCGHQSRLTTGVKECGKGAGLKKIAAFFDTSREKHQRMDTSRENPVRFYEVVDSVAV